MKEIQKDLIKSAEIAVTTLECVELGEAWRTEYDGATAAIGELRARACGEVFPGNIEPVGKDILADLDYYTEPFPYSTYTADVIDLHERSLQSYPNLATIIRGALMRQRIGDIAGTRLVVTQRPESELIQEALREFEDKVSAQLAKRGELKPWCDILSVTVPTLENRVADARKKQEEHVAAEVARVLRERKEAEQILIREAEDKQSVLDQAAKAAERVAAEKLRAALHARACALAGRIDALGTKTIKMNRRSYSAGEICTILRNYGYSEKKLAAIEMAVAWLEKNTRRR